MKHSHGETIADFLALIRLPNLFIVALTMLLMRYAIIRPLLGAMPVTMADDPFLVTRMALQVSWIDFLVLVMATVLITAAGYVINDYFDIRTDIINRGNIIVGNTIRRRKAMMYHNVLNFLGIVAGFYVSARIGYFWLGMMFVVVSGLLYFYSSTYKRQFLIGNLIVATLTGMVPMIAVIYDAIPIFRHYSGDVISFPGVALLFYWVGGFSVFAFLTTLIREIIKDMEDYNGDMELQRKTLPVVAGFGISRVIITVLSLITIGLLCYIWYYYLNDTVTLIWMLALLLIPFVYVLAEVISGKEKRQLHRASRVMKLIMLAGILYSLAAGAIISTGKII